jgi:hypothetical protein
MNISTSAVSWRSVEKLLAYGAALVGSTNGFAQLSMPTSVRNVLIGAAAVVVYALHSSGPAETPNTSTSPTVVENHPTTSDVGVTRVN